MNLLRGARFFVTIVEERHFGHAADRLGVTQPPLSQGLKRLEEALGVRLIDRSRQGATVTEAGAALLPYMRALLDDETEVLRMAQELTADRQDIHVGAVETLPASIVTALVASCAAASVHDVTLRTSSTAAIVEDIQRQRLDLGVVDHPSIIGDLVGSDVAILAQRVICPASPLRSPTESIHSLLDRPVATRPRACAPAVHDLLEDTLRALGIKHGTTTVPDERSALALVVTDRARLLSAEPSTPPDGLTAVDLPRGVLPLRLRVIHRRDEHDQDVLNAAEALESTLNTYRTAEDA